MSSQMPLRREVFVLVAAGAALGIVYNSMGLASRPPRGIPWVAATAELPSLEDMTPADSAMSGPGAELGAPVAGSPPSAAPTSGNPVTAPSAGTQREADRSARADRPPLASAGARPAGGATSRTGSGEPAATSSASAGAVPEPRRSAPLPFIPDSDQPIQVQTATAKRFFDARAALFLDARDPAEYEKGHIPGAIRLTNAEAQNEPQRVKSLPVEGRPVIAYCEGGACEASLELARFLLESGFRKVLVYMGGYPEWEAAGHPVERGSGR